MLKYIEIFKGTPICFDLKEHHQGAVLYHVKVTE